jgi:predicted lipid-binding transport protein (Tim44 family)
MSYREPPLGRRAYPQTLSRIVTPHGVGDALTDWACDQAAQNESWRARVDEGLGAGAQAALIGGLAAGLLGGILKRPAVGAVVGGMIGWGAHAIWTAPLTAS